MSDSTHELQAAVEGVPVGDRVTFLGDTYRIADRVGLMPLMKFAHAASKGMDSEDLEGLSAMYEMIRDCIAPEDWPRFERDAVDKRAEAEDLMKVVTDTIELLTARPTSRPAVSSGGPQPTSASSTASSPSQDAPTGPKYQVPDLVSVDELMRRAGA